MAHLTDQPGRLAPAQPVRAVPAATRRSGLPGTLLSEFTKLRSVRSTWITLAVFFVASVVIAVLSAAGDTSFFAGQAAVASTHAGASITSPGTLRALLLATLFVPCFALVAFGLGAVIRHTAGAITAVFGLVFLLPTILGAFPASWSSALGRWLPDNTVLLQIVAAKPTGQHAPPPLLPVIS